MTETPRKKASDFHPRILEVFDGYVHGRVSKREFIELAGKFAAAGVTGAMIFNQLKPDYALAKQVEENDPAIKTMTASFFSKEGHGEIKGYMAKPARRRGKLPAVLVIHENRGLNPYIRDVVRRIAKAGFLAFGPDGLSPLGGYPGTDEKGREMQASMDATKLMEDFFAAYAMRLPWPIPIWRHRCPIMVGKQPSPTCLRSRPRC
jgi:carboxymethylenebutenolidase